ncbi:MAG: NADH-quinone oxidoreductase subunit A [Deltaproteobacteria bacterium]|nr:NADH-quinone oxidoreductase subunit A [Deltaproteobacteria bacterium]
MLLGLLIGVVPLVLPLLISPRYKGAETSKTYECGIDTVGSAWSRFGLGYTLFALVFVAFEVDLLYLFPVALVLRAHHWAGVAWVALFLAILSLALVFVWRKGVFTWTLGTVAPPPPKMDSPRAS